MRLKMFRGTERFNKWFLYLAGFLVFGTLAISFADVMSRVLFKTSIFWAVQGATWAMLLLSFLGAGMILWERGHVNTDFLLAILKGKPKKVLDIVNHAAALLFVCMALIAGISYTWQLFVSKVTRAVGGHNITYWPIILIAAVFGPAVLLLFSIAMLLRVIREHPGEAKKGEVGAEQEKGG